MEKNINNIYFIYQIKRQNILNEIVKLEINSDEKDEKKKLMFDIQKVDEIIYNDLIVKINLCKIDKKIESNKININIIIEFTGNKLSVSKPTNVLQENIFLFNIKFYNNNFSQIDIIQQYNIFQKYLEKSNLQIFKSHLRTYFIELLLKNLNIYSNNLSEIFIESLKKDEFENLKQILLKIDDLSFIETKNEGIEELKNLLIELVNNNDFKNTIKNDLDYQKIYININILLSITYIKLKEFEKFYQIIYNLNSEYIEIFLQNIEKRNIFHILNIKELFIILRNINSNNKTIKIPTSVFEYLISLLKDNKEKINLIFNKNNDLYIYLNDDLKKRNHPPNNQENGKPIPDVKENSIDIEKILNFNEISEENENNILLFLKKIYKHYFSSFKIEKFLRYIFYFNIVSILKSIYEITTNYRNLTLLKEILNKMKDYLLDEDNDDENNDIHLNKLIEDCKLKIDKVIIDKINDKNSSPESYFKTINNFLNNKNEGKEEDKKENEDEDEDENKEEVKGEKLKQIILQNQNNFKVMINSIKLSFFLNLDSIYQNLIFEIFKENDLINFIEHKLEDNNEFKIINQFYEFIYLGLNKVDKKFLPIYELFAIKINKILKQYDSSTKFLDNSIFKIILHLNQFISKKNKENNDKNKLNIFLNVPLTVIINLYLFYQQQEEKNLDSYFEHLIEKIATNYNLNNDFGIISCLDFIIDTQKISTLDINKQDLIKKILSYITFEPISNKFFFEKYLTPNESLYIDLKKLKIIENKKLFPNNKFINESFNYLENMKEQITNQKINFSELLNFGNFLNDTFNDKILLIYEKSELEKEKKKY